MASRTTTATAAITIAGMLCLSAIANAANDGGPQWPNLYEPKWPNVPGERGYDPAKATPAPAAEPEIITGSVNKASPVAARWGEFVQPPAIFGEFGLRYVFSSNKTAKNLYDLPGGMMVSRLTYSGMDGHAAEGFGRVEHTGGIFLKGYVGAGVLLNGKLQDEDFPPGISPYSSTDSRQKDGTLANAAICGGGLPEPWKVISQSNQWSSLRVGLDAKIALGDRFSLSLDAAYLPNVRLNGRDTHWLRIGTNPGDFTGPVPEDGKGTGYQLEAVLSYAVNPNVSFAVGGRYWRMETSGNTHFEDHVVGVNAMAQPVDWKVENLGVFVQGSFKFGPYPTGGF